MKALLIDPTAKTVTPIEINNWREIAPTIDADFFDCVNIDDKHTLYVDDEGLYTKNDFFQYLGYPQPLAGKGLILGLNEEGESIDCTLTIEQVLNRTFFQLN